MQLCKTKSCCVLFREKRLSAGNSTKHAILVIFSNCTVMNFYSSELLKQCFISIIENEKGRCEGQVW